MDVSTMLILYVVIGFIVFIVLSVGVRIKHGEFYTENKEEIFVTLVGVSIFWFIVLPAISLFFCLYLIFDLIVGDD